MKNVRIKKIEATNAHIKNNFESYIDKIVYDHRFIIKNCIKENKIEKFVDFYHPDVKKHRKRILNFDAVQNKNISIYLEKKEENSNFENFYKLVDKKKEKLAKNPVEAKENLLNNDDIVFKDLEKKYKNKGYKLPENLRENLFKSSSLLMDNNKIIDFLHFSEKKDIYNHEMQYLKKINVMVEDKVSEYNKRYSIIKEENSVELQNDNFERKIDLLVEKRKYKSNLEDEQKLLNYVNSKLFNESTNNTNEVIELKFFKEEFKKNSNNKKQRTLKDGSLSSKKNYSMKNKSAIDLSSNTKIINDNLEFINTSSKLLKSKPISNNISNQSTFYNSTLKSTILNKTLNRTMLNELKIKKYESNNEEYKKTISSNNSFSSKNVKFFYRKLDNKKLGSLINKEKKVDNELEKDKFGLSTFININEQAFEEARQQHKSLLEKQSKLKDIFERLKHKQVNDSLFTDINNYLKNYLPEDYANMKTMYIFI